MAPVKGFDEYADLPEPIRLSLSHRQYAWLSDAEKANLQETMTEPEIPEDPAA